MSVATTFDTSYPLMAVASEAGAYEIAYRHQVALLESLLRPGMTVLDVGCGPRLPYRADDVYVIGLDPSSASLAANTDVDERIVGSARDIPLPSGSVDMVVAFYSLHHMTGATRAESFQTRLAAFREMGRVARPGGQILVFEMAPWPPIWWAETLWWDDARRAIGAPLDMLFWPYGPMEEAAWRAGLGDFDGPSVQTFPCSPFALFPPVFSLPWLKIPRFLYPFTPTLYTWSAS